MGSGICGLYSTTIEEEKIVSTEENVSTKDDKPSEEKDKPLEEERTYPGNRTEEEYNDLARDPSHGNNITDKGEEERRIGLELEAEGKLGRIVRDTSLDKNAEFIDTTTGIKWDIKAFRSYPAGHTSAKKGAFKVEKAIAKIEDEFNHGHNVIVDLNHLTTEHQSLLKQAIKERGYEERIIWYEKED